MTPVGRGVTKPQKVTLELDGERIDAIWKTLDRRPNATYRESWEAEVAAYRLSRELRLDLVPPTVERRIGRDRAPCSSGSTGSSSTPRPSREPCPPP